METTPLLMISAPDVMYALRNLGRATAKQVADYLGADRCRVVAVLAGLQGDEAVRCIDDGVRRPVWEATR